MEYIVHVNRRHCVETRWSNKCLDILANFPFYMHTIAESTIQPGWKYTHQASKYNVIEIPLNQTLTVENVEGIIQVPPGYAIYLPSQEYNELSYSGSGVLHKLAFAFYGTLSNSMSLALLGPWRLLKINVETIKKYFKIFQDMVIASKHEELPKFVGISTEFLTDLACQQELVPQNTQIILASEYIFTELPNKIHTKKIADSLNVSTWHLQQLFKKEYNITPGKYVRERQLELAMRLLQSSDMQIQVIANQLGYSSAFAFSNAFKKLTGYSPREWRKINKGCFDKQY